MDHPQISVIIPVYKAEKFLHRCLDSILAQTYSNWELLLVNDGSPDNSGAICEEYAAKDARIKVFHKENGGVSAARNTALERAKGVFVTFVDSDDWIDKDCLNTCINNMINNELDLVQFGLRKIKTDGTVLSEKLLLSKREFNFGNPTSYC